MDIPLGRGLAAPEKHATPHMGHMKSILIVEDTADLRELYMGVLEDSGYHVICAEHGEEALRMLEGLGGDPCLVLLDMMMPVMDGAEFIRVLRDTHRLAALPVVLVSALTMDGGEPGVRKTLRKPVSRELLVAVVREFCGAP
jgi:CheY-like chemotaxis protein